MRRLQGIRLYLLLLMIVLFAISIFTVAGQAMSFYKQYVKQISTVRGVQSLNDASNIIIKELSNIARQCANEEYVAMDELANSGTIQDLSEDILYKYYRGGYYKKIEAAVGNNSADICRTLDEMIAISGSYRTRIIDNGKARLDAIRLDDGSVVSIKLSDILMEYTDPIIGKRSDTVSYIINIPKVIFYTENSTFTDYCMVAMKGIYATGDTSSIIGNLYAGSHTKDEQRSVESMYGEVGTYGGINVLSTQLAICADNIISTGDININGSFVIMTPENNKLECYAKNLNSVKGFAKDSMYSLDGDFYSTAMMNEKTLTEYYSQANRIEDSIVRLDDIEWYYDSSNDPTYKCKYDKILSPTDVELKSDFSGVVMTPYNVIIENGVNFEGIIICGDRIYIRGNNNIVENNDVIRSIIAYESDAWGENLVIDFLDGIRSKGIVEPDYYVIPYR